MLVYYRNTPNAVAICAYKMSDVDEMFDTSRDLIKRDDVAQTVTPYETDIPPAKVCYFIVFAL